MNTPFTLQSRRSGFTLLEIMLVVTIIALLLGAGIYATKGQFGFAQDTRVQGDMNSISGQLKLYYATNGFYPTTEQGLKALVEKPQTDPVPRHWRQLFDKVPIDPWDSDYVYAYPGTHNANSFDLSSKGQDRKEGTADDIGNWSK